MATTRDWDAATYHRVSVPHQEWARAVLDRLRLTGDETVLDAGCGSGRVTTQLIERLPQGRVVAVDGSPSMVEKARTVLRPVDRALVADLTQLRLEEPVDAVFSSAVFHWITDHDALFASMRAALRRGGRLAAQCGGSRNIEGFLANADGVASRDPYVPHLEERGRKWLFATPEATTERLERAGFGGVRCWLEPWTVTPPEPTEFLRTVCLGPYLDLLPEELHGRFVCDVLALEQHPLELRYVRLNIEAVAS